ncbi:hypothetical protein ABQ284_04505 [Lentilactobacillus buchneri]|uniref:hypothetical protein n=1 Tax=Lentilactobacillus buchneri TaxID=1581 RepID=UPI0030F331FD
MKLSKIASLLGVAVLGVTLSACGNTKSSKENSSSKTMTSKVTAKKPQVLHDKFHVKKIFSKTIYPKKGDWMKGPEGQRVTYLTSLQDIPNQTVHGMKLFNTQYAVIAMENLSSDNEYNSMQPDAKTVFPNNGDFPKSLTGKTIILLHLESDFQNNTSKPLNYDGFSGYAGGNFDWTTDNGVQIDHSSLQVNDETNSLTVQPHKTVQDKSMDAILCYGNNVQDAYKKINSKHLTIKTAGVSTEDESQLGGIRTLKLNVK